MRQFLSNIVKTFSSNLISLLSGVLVGFLVPKMMGIEGYANYKIYTLYLTYLAITSLGLGDGLTLRFAGKDRKELDASSIRYYTRRYYLQIAVFAVVGILASLLIVSQEYRFIAIALSVSILSTQIIGLHQNFSVLSSKFGEYSKRIVIRALLITLFVVGLYLHYLYSYEELSYIVYIVGIVSIDLILAAWYIYTYRDFSFGYERRQHGTDSYVCMLFTGIPLLFSNMAGTIFLNIDRQFVSVLFAKEIYAVYAFAYNMFTLVTTMTSAISIVLFPSMRKIEGFDIRSHLQRYLSLFSILIVLSMVVYYPLSVVVHLFLEKYVNSIEVLRIILPGLVMSSCVTVIFNNFYKIEDRIMQYFGKTMLSIAFSIVLNYCAWLLFQDYRAISMASIISLTFWCALAAERYIRVYRVNMSRVCFYVLTMFVFFYVLTFLVANPYVGTVLYLTIFTIVTYMFFPNILREVFAVSKK